MNAQTLQRPVLIYVGEGWTQDIGTTGDPMVIGAAKLWTRATSGKTWWSDGTHATPTAWVICDSTAPNPLSHDCLSVTGSTTDLLEVLRGKTTIIGGAVTDFVVASRNPGANEAMLVINTGAAVTTGKQYGGQISNSVAITTMTVEAGTYTQEVGATGAITTLEANGGRVNLNYAGTYGTVRHRAGCILDVTQDGSIKTFTNYYRYPGSILIGENSGLLTIGSAFDVRG